MEKEEYDGRNDWKDGREVVMRGEAPGSDVAKLAAVTTRAEHLALSAVVRQVIEQARQQGGLFLEPPAPGAQ
jgi:hypothetical protein